MRLIRVVLSVCLLAATAFAQDPLKTLPNAYKLEFENEYVRVVRVHYAPHEKLPAHEHTFQASAYVYLTDGGPVVFNHVDKEYGAVTRPATKGGSFRVYHGIQEHHEVENQSDLPSDFLRVEFKTEAINDKSLKGRYFREEYPAGQNVEKVQFENEQVRIIRLVCAVGKTLDVSTSASEPSLLIAMSPADFKVSTGKGKAQKLKLGLGQGKWLALNQSGQLTNTGKGPAELLRFDFKTRPLTKEELEQSHKHEHPSK